MSVIGKVSAVFTANSSGLVSGVNQAARSMSRMERSTKSLASGMRTLVAIQGAQLFGSMASTAGPSGVASVSAGALLSSPQAAASRATAAASAATLRGVRERVIRC